MEQFLYSAEIIQRINVDFTVMTQGKPTWTSFSFWRKTNAKCFESLVGVEGGWQVRQVKMGTGWGGH
jgi:hypothetical protein